MSDFDITTFEVLKYNLKLFYSVDSFSTLA